MLEKNTENIEYERELEKLQVELVKLQRWVQEENKRIIIIFEGRDTAGKGGAILRFTQYLNPRAMRIVALPKPTDREKTQWYFQRYVKELPAGGEIVFFDRSWYNRAVVEPVMGFCSPEQYKLYLRQVPVFERMLYEDGIILFKLWYSITIKEQKLRLEERRINPLKQWKLSTVDMQAQQKWNDFTRYKDNMFRRTHRDYSPWVIVNGNNKEIARLESIRYVLSRIEYAGKYESDVIFTPNPNIVRLYKHTTKEKRKDT